MMEVEEEGKVAIWLCEEKRVIGGFGSQSFPRP